MARIGFKKAKYNMIDKETGKFKEVTGGVPEFEKVVDEKFAAEYNSAELYANDALCESDYSFKKGTLTITIADDKDELLAELFGNTIESTEGAEVTSNIEDTAPEFGYGHVIPKIVGGVRKYKVEFFPRVKFTSVTSDNKTRGESVEFSTTVLEATVFPLEVAMNGHKAGDWECHETFATLDAAYEALDAYLTPTASA